MRNMWNPSRFTVQKVLALVALVVTVNGLAFPSSTHAQPSHNSPSPISGREPTEAQLQLADVWSRIVWVAEEAESLRRYLGKPLIEPLGLKVTGGALPELYVQAVMLHDLSHRLAFEHTGQSETTPASVAPNLVQPFHVWKMVNEAFAHLVLIKQTFGLSQTSQEKTPVKAVYIREVLQTLWGVNRQINLLLERPFAPRDVYRQVTQAVYYTARLIGQFPGVQRMPAPPPFAPNKQPKDVLTYLLTCYQLLSDIREQAGLKRLALDPTGINGSSIRPGDVFQVASLLVSELAALSQQISHPFPVLRAIDPGRKFPSHVYQRVGLLYAQLQTLNTHIHMNPDWLQGGKKP